MPYAEATPRADVKTPSVNATKWLVIHRGDGRMVGSVVARGWYLARAKAEIDLHLERDQFDLEEISE